MLDEILLQQNPDIILNFFNSILSFLTKTYGDQLNSSLLIFKQQHETQKQLYVILLTLHREKSLLDWILTQESNPIKLQSFLPSLHSLSEQHLDFKLTPTEYIHQCKSLWIIS